MTSPCCDIFDKFGGAESAYVSNDHWTVQVRPKQATLGASVLISKAHHESLAGLSPEEATGLADAVTRMEQRLRDAFQFDKINYLMLMMVDRHLHFHVIPRYAKSPTFAGIEWPDPVWPKGPPALDQAAGGEAERKEVVKKLKAE